MTMYRRTLLHFTKDIIINIKKGETKTNNTHFQSDKCEIPSNSTDTGQGDWLPFTGPTNNSSQLLVFCERPRSEQINSSRSTA